MVSFFFKGRICHLDDLHNWTTYPIRRHRPNLHGPQVTQLQSCGTSTYEVKTIFTKMQHTTPTTQTKSPFIFKRRLGSI